METDKALYNKYQNQVSDYDTFKVIRSKKLKTMLFTGWVAQFGSKVVRETLGINYSTYGYLLKQYGPNASANDDDTKEKKQMGRPKKDERKIIDVEGYTRTEPIIEAEKNQLAVIEETSASKEPTEAPKVTQTPFISVEWTNTPETIKNQLEALVNVLLFEKGAITVKLDVFKNNSII